MTEEQKNALKTHYLLTAMKYVEFKISLAKYLGEEEVEIESIDGQHFDKEFANKISAILSVDGYKSFVKCRMRYVIYEWHFDYHIVVRL